jgi:hypothetical protein
MKWKSKMRCVKYQVSDESKSDNNARKNQRILKSSTNSRINRQQLLVEIGILNQKRDQIIDVTVTAILALPADSIDRTVPAIDDRSLPRWIVLYP